MRSIYWCTAFDQWQINLENNKQIWHPEKHILDAEMMLVQTDGFFTKCRAAQEPFRLVHKIWWIWPLVSISSICLRAAFKRADLKSAKKTVILSSFIAILGSARIKAAHRMLVKLTPGVNFINMHTCSFYTRRSQKGKKTVKWWVEKKLTDLLCCCTSADLHFSLCA